MRPVLFLSDAAQLAVGKVSALGIGWERTPLGMTPWAIGGYVDVPWDQSNRDHTLRVALFTTDGQAVTVPTPMGDHAFVIEAVFQVGRPPGIVAGSYLRVPIALSLAPLPIALGRYEFRVSIDEQPFPDSTMTMQVVPLEEIQPGAQGR